MQAYNQVRYAKLVKYKVWYVKYKGWYVKGKVIDMNSLELNLPKFRSVPCMMLRCLIFNSYKFHRSQYFETSGIY